MVLKFDDWVWAWFVFLAENVSDDAMNLERKTMRCYNANVKLFCDDVFCIEESRPSECKNESHLSFPLEKILIFLG